MIYLDNAATTFPKSESVYKAMDEANRSLAVNAGRGSYTKARQAAELISNTKKTILKLVNGVNIAEVAFTPSVTIAMNEILAGLPLKENDIIYVSPYEHNAVARPLELLVKKKKIRVKELPINQGSLEIDMDKIRYLFSKEPPVCVCCTHISNVTGYILPVSEIFEVAKEYQAVTVLDAAQSLGLLSVDVNVCNADFIAFAGHKTLYGPVGIAGFIDVAGVELEEYIVGGTGSDSLNLSMPVTSPSKYESASPNVVAIAGLAAALDELEGNYLKEKELSDYLIEKLGQIEGIKLYLPKNIIDNHVGIVSFNLEGYKADDIGIILDEDYGIAVRTGYHCAPYVHEHLKDEKYLGTVRVGIGKFNKKEQVDELVNAVIEIME